MRIINQSSHGLPIERLLTLLGCDGSWIDHRMDPIIFVERRHKRIQKSRLSIICVHTRTCFAANLLVWCEEMLRACYTRSKILESLLTGRVYSVLSQVTLRRCLLSTDSSSQQDGGVRRFRVGFIGLGNMGLPMAENLAMTSDQVQLLAYDANPRVSSDSSLSHCHNVEFTGSPAEVANRDCDVIFTMLPGCDAVNAVMEELHDNLLKSTNSSATRYIVDCSTVSPTTSRKWHEKWMEAASTTGRFMFFDAPVSGGVKGATNATLTFMVGCPSNIADENEWNRMENVIRPLLERMGQKIVLCGGPGTGAAIKLCNNLALATQMVGVCEAMNLGESLGVDPKVLASVMNTSTAACWSSKTNNPHPTAAADIAIQNNDSMGTPACQNYEGGFGTNLMLKDLGLAVSAAEECGVAAPLAAQTKELYRLAKLRGHGDKDFGVMLQFLKGL